MGAVDAAEVAIFVGPVVPDFDVIVFKVFYIGIAADEPEEFVDDRFEVDFFGGEEGEGLGEVVAGLGAEDADGADAGSVCALFSVLEDVGEEV